MPNTSHIFISHASADDGFVKQLRIKLELLGLKVWVDSRNLPGGAPLKPEIQQAIESAAHFLVVMSPNTQNSTWVKDEIEWAEAVASQQEDYRIIPLLLDGVEASALRLWFKEPPLGITVKPQVGQLDQALPDIFAALGRRLPDDYQPIKAVEAKPVSELLLDLMLPQLTQLKDGSFQLSSQAKLDYIPTDTTQDDVNSKIFTFTAPLGQIERDELRWYLEHYPHWPTGLFQQRAERIEAQLPQWGQQLYDAIFKRPECRGVINAWHSAKTQGERRFSIRIEHDSNDAPPEVLKAASQLMSLPWELLHDGEHWLSDGANPVRVRRRLPNPKSRTPLMTELPIRILLVSPRPEEKGTGYIDHRAAALPLVEAIERLGELAEVHLLSPPTIPALMAELKRANDNHQPYHVLHFDGHGVYDARYGLGALCFEDPADADKPNQRGMQLVYAKQQVDNQESQVNLAGLLRDYRIPLVFLEACQSAQSEIDPNASVAASLLQEGVASVVAMSHSVLVKSATLFVTAFYQALAQGQRLGQAMLAGQQALMADPRRLTIAGAGVLSLNDWFVPILYQEKHDPQLFPQIPSDKAHQLQQQQHAFRLGALPPTPEHQFIGRSKALLTLERLLFAASFNAALKTSRGASMPPSPQYVVIQGPGGMGKTTLAVESCRWLVRSQRVDRCAFVSLETDYHPRAVLERLGKQLVGEHYSVAEYGDDLDQALQPLQRSLDNERVILLLDNLESLLADRENTAAVLKMLAPLYSPQQHTRWVLTSRESLPAPFNQASRTLTLGELSNDDAQALILNVMATQGLHLTADKEGNSPEQVQVLIRQVHGHARALVLIAKALAQQSIQATRDNLQRIMQGLEQAHPGERENSLWASVALSIERLSPEQQAQITGLAVFHDGGNLYSIAHVLDIDTDTARQLAQALIAIGLATLKSYNYLRLDPALPSYLNRCLSQADKSLGLERWMAVMSQIVAFLYQQRTQDTQLAAQLTEWELPNLMAYLHHLNQQSEQGDVPTETVIDQAGSIEQLLEFLPFPQALAEVVAIRQQAAQHLGTWSAARFEHERLSIERHLAQGDLPQALSQAEQLLQRSQQAGPDAYAGADYDLAMAHSMLGEVLMKGGAAAQALPVLQQAFEGFEVLGERGARMASASLSEIGDCLRALGQLEPAAAAYQEAIQRSEKRDAIRDVAANKTQLATVRLHQKDYPAARQGYQEALELFQQLNEPASVATIYHQFGMVHKRQNQFESAENAYRQSLSIKSQQNNRAGEANSLNELGNLYEAWNRPEQAVTYYQQAADIAFELGDKIKEGIRRSNLAHTLIQLQRLDQARPELLRAIECKKPYGHAATPWTTWDILTNLEHAAGNSQAAQEARQKAIQAYFAYRRDGGENHDGAGRLALVVLEAIRQGETGEVLQTIEQLLEQEDGQKHKTFLQRLQAVLNGERHLTLAEDDGEMYYQHLAELKILIEKINEPEEQLIADK